MIDKLIEAAEAFKNCEPKDRMLRFYTSGTGIPDDYAISYFSKTNIIVITRSGKEYLYGKERIE